MTNKETAKGLEQEERAMALATSRDGKAMMMYSTFKNALRTGDKDGIIHNENECQIAIKDAMTAYREAAAMIECSHFNAWSARHDMLSPDETIPNTLGSAYIIEEYHENHEEKKAVNNARVGILRDLGLEFAAMVHPPETYETAANQARIHDAEVRSARLSFEDALKSENEDRIVNDYNEFLRAIRRADMANHRAVAAANRAYVNALNACRDHLAAGENISMCAGAVNLARINRESHRKNLKMLDDLALNLILRALPPAPYDIAAKWTLFGDNKVNAARSAFKNAIENGDASQIIHSVNEFLKAATYAETAHLRGLLCIHQAHVDAHRNILTVENTASSRRVLSQARLEKSRTDKTRAISRLEVLGILSNFVSVLAGVHMENESPETGWWKTFIRFFSRS